MTRIVRPDQPLPPTDTPARSIKWPTEVDDYSTRRKCLDHCPIKAGDVVWIDEGKPARAVVIMVFAERDSMLFYRQKFRIVRLTAAGKWSKLWEYAWPGQIERAQEVVGDVA